RKRQRQTDRRAAEDNELVNHVTDADAACFRVLSIRIFEQVECSVAGKAGRNEIKHDGVDDFMIVTTRSQPTGDRVPKRSGQHGSHSSKQRRNKGWALWP